MFSLGYPSVTLLRRLRFSGIPLAAVAFFAVAASAESVWKLVWADEFDVDGAPNPANWTFDLGGGGWGNQEVQVYTDSLDNARVEDGRLIIEVRRTEGTGRPVYTSARMLTRGLHSWQYGRFEVRARLPRTTGTWSAIWMLSENSIFPGAFWPDNGEIDIMEHVGYEEDPLYHAIRGSVPNNIHSTLHTRERNHLGAGGIGGSTFLETATEAFNTYALNWFEDRMEFELNGEIYFVVHKADTIPGRNPPDDLSPWWPFDQPFHLILNVAVGGMWGGVFNESFFPDSPYGPSGIDHDGEWPQRLEVEYVRVFALADDLWRGFPRVGEAYADSGPWLGMLYVGEEPWIYSFEHGWIYLPESTHSPSGSWSWWPRSAP